MMRNKLFDWEVLQSKSFDIPIISVGNLAVGGTGKTPHTEYLIKFLCNQYKVAVLSRGYKRHTKGYVLATPESTARSIGDEPYQMHQKFPSVTVAVDEKRCHGIEKLLALQKAFNRCYPIGRCFPAPIRQTGIEYSVNGLSPIIL